MFEKLKGLPEKNYVTLRVAEKLKWNISEHARLFQDLEYLPQVDRFGNYVANASVKLEADITTSLALNDSTVLSWEDCPNRSLEDVLWHVEASKVCHLSGLMTALNQGTEPPLDAVRRLKRALGTAGLNMAVAA